MSISRRTTALGSAFAVALLMLLGGCRGGGVLSAPEDGGALPNGGTLPDGGAETDAGTDAGIDAGIDAGTDAGTDFRIGGTLSGLAAGASLTLLSSTGEERTLSANGGFFFTTRQPAGSHYSSRAFKMPTGQTCTLASSAGTVPEADVTTVQVACVRTAVSSLTWAPGSYLMGGAHKTAANVLGGGVNTTPFAGVQMLYAWADTEPTKDVYDFSSVDVDLAAVAAAGKKMVIMLQYKAFTSVSTTAHAVPAYLRTPGGPYCSGQSCGEVRMGNGYAALVWQDATRDRLERWMSALGAHLTQSPHADLVAGVVLPETACSGCDTVTGDGYTVDGYLAALEDVALTLRAAFPKLIVLEYINFFPPNAHADTYLTQFAEFALANPGVGLGCPDLGTVSFSPPGYSVLENARYAGTLPIGPAVEAPDYGVDRNNTVAETINLATSGMSAQLLGWFTSYTPAGGTLASGAAAAYSINDVAAYLAAHPLPTPPRPTWCPTGTSCP